ncbi:rhodanese-like domain-containing protein [Aquiluna borgnonia]|uniref:Rhodanese-like domain-containing protein n=1 Tax=Aquiluna borgnonia TaxID=2499157 RepID=A0A7D4QNA7_9MICO|nr:rhodanese-like domain-containing protein [Aquiluna borgnonia]QKJ25567.1 rhodanese-like domain-containing protein [Aquiluna borgnonia]
MGLFDFFKKKYQTVSPAKAKEAQDAGALLIDVRESHEYRSGHAPGAKHISVQVIERRLGEIPKERPILVMCQSGMRSQRAAEILSRNGYQVMNVSGGIVNWQRAGMKVVK